MPIIRQRRILRHDLRNNPDRIYVFGDNMAGCGFGGQARVCRGEPNAVGVPTKHFPNNDITSFFCDADFDKVRPRIDEAFSTLRQHLECACIVIIPADGLGTGRAQLETRAPTIYKYICDHIHELESVFGTMRCLNV
jgi:hypothetical protein